MKKNIRRRSLLVCILLQSIWVAFAQTAAPANASSAAGQQLATLASMGYPLTVNSNVNESTSIEAVLLPYNIAKHAFGVETARNYIVIEVTVTNHNPQASLVIQSVFLDYSHWLILKDKGGNSCENGAPESPSDTTQFQRTTCPGQIASAEYRLVRAELLDRQPYTARNLLINGATAVGSIATAFVFPFSEDVIKGVNAWNGALVPAASSMFPDSTVNQLNHISDLGFQTNKVIPKQSSDIVVAFFPINRLLTNGLARIYRHDPAAFFIPNEIVLDPKAKKQLVNMMKEAFGDQDFDSSSLSKALNANCPVTSPGGDNSGFSSAGKGQSSSLGLCEEKSFIQSIALTNVQIGVGGDMTVSTQAVPPTITGYSIANSADNTSVQLNSTFWAATNAKPSTGTVTIFGTFLSQGVPEIVDSQGVPIPGLTITPITQNATDSSLPFSINFKQCITKDTDLNLKVTKPQVSTGAASTGVSSGVQSTSQVSSMLFDIGRLGYPSSACTTAQ